MPSPAQSQLPKLNERQQLYLRAADQLDQQLEQRQQYDYVRGVATMPASEWRRLPYGRWKHLAGRPATDLRKLIEAQQAPGKRLVDPGAGSTWKALAERGLVDIEERVIIEYPDPRVGYSPPYLRLTRAGRKLVRQLTGEKRAVAPRRPKPQQPGGLLPQQVWRALVLAYQQDAAGVALDSAERFHAFYARIPRNIFAWLERLGLVAAGPLTSGPDAQWPASCQVTERGRDYYQQYYRVNTAAYWSVPAELPRPVLSAAHRAFWQRVHELSGQRDAAGLDEQQRFTTRQQLLWLQLSQLAGALYVAPCWYPALAGRGITTLQNRSPEDFRCGSEPEARALAEQLKRGGNSSWQFCRDTSRAAALAEM